MKKIVPFLLLLVCSLIWATPNDAKPFYADKVMKIICTTKPGGGYDFYARAMAKVMPKYLPGATIIVKNIPGAGHIIGTNAIYHAKPDGLTFGTFNRATGMPQVAGVKGVQYDLSKMSWLGCPSSEIFGFIVHNSFKDLDDVLKAEKIRIATGGYGDLAFLTTLLFYDMMGKDNFQFNTGYAGAEIAMAIMRREADGNFGSYDSRKVMVEDGYGRFVMFIGKEKPPGYENVPSIREVVKDPRHKPLIDLLVGLNAIARPFAGPPGIAPDRLKILREAFKKSVEDPEFIGMSEKSDKRVDFSSAEECEAHAKNLFSLPPKVNAIIKQAFMER